jgi:NAD-dependent dihydropyrimidine dehydrogenase PreA subunit
VTKVIVPTAESFYSVIRGETLMAYVIAEPCIGTKDTACVDACPVDCIHPKEDDEGSNRAPQLYIDAETCICCAACVPVCPVSAIYAEEDLPSGWEHFVQINAEHFAQVKS